MKSLILKIIIIFCLVLQLPTYAQDSENIVLKWNQAALNAIIATKTAPPIAARALAILHTAIFDAWAPYDSKATGTRLGNSIRVPEAERIEANKQKAISYAACVVLADLFPTEKETFFNLMETLGYDVADTAENTTTPSGIGNTVANNLLTFRHNDGSNQLGDLNTGKAYSDYTGFTSVNTSSTLNDPNKWQPLNSSGNDQSFLVPHWGMVTPFALTAGNDFRPPAPGTYPSSKYTAQAKQILKISELLNDKTKIIAEYWADGSGTVTPPGHWNKIAQFISKRDGHTLDDDVKIFFILDNAVFDAGIAAWDAKITYNSIRPISAIRFLFNGKKVLAWGGAGQGTKEINGEEWNPYIITPPFAEYVSGHSTFSAAAAETLKLCTKSDRYDDSTSFDIGTSSIEKNSTPKRKITLRWRTFSEAANEAGISRRYGGIHFLDGDLEGRKLGKKIGREVYSKANSYINGEHRNINITAK